ncbi:hypothetical protein ES705_17568 [subsurface metagenome]
MVMLISGSSSAQVEMGRISVRPVAKDKRMKVYISRGASKLGILPLSQEELAGIHDKAQEYLVSRQEGDGGAIRYMVIREKEMLLYIDEEGIVTIFTFKEFANVIGESVQDLVDLRKVYKSIEWEPEE